jgi:hypothetical protein
MRALDKNSFTSPIGVPPKKNNSKGEVERTVQCASPIVMPITYKLGFTKRKWK